MPRSHSSRIPLVSPAGCPDGFAATVRTILSAYDNGVISERAKIIGLYLNSLVAAGRTETQTEIAETFGWSKQSVSRAVLSLEDIKQRDNSGTTAGQQRDKKTMQPGVTAEESETTCDNSGTTAGQQRDKLAQSVLEHDLESPLPPRTPSSSSYSPDSSLLLDSSESRELQASACAPYRDEIEAGKIRETFALFRRYHQPERSRPMSQAEQAVLAAAIKSYGAKEVQQAILGVKANRWVQDKPKERATLPVILRHAADVVRNGDAWLAWCERTGHDPAGKLPDPDQIQPTSGRQNEADEPLPSYWKPAVLPGSEAVRN